MCLRRYAYPRLKPTEIEAKYGRIRNKWGAFMCKSVRRHACVMCTFQEASHEQLVSTTFLEQTVFAETLLLCTATKGLVKGHWFNSNQILHSSSWKPALCRKDENLIKPVPCMALQNYTRSRAPSHPVHHPLTPLWLPNVTGWLHVVTKLWSCRCNAGSRFIRDRPLTLWSRKWNKKVPNSGWRKHHYLSTYG
jgi:hypothetical protein